jgi:hypothetical protein
VVDAIAELGAPSAGFTPPITRGHGLPFARGRVSSVAAVLQVSRIQSLKARPRSFAARSQRSTFLGGDTDRERLARLTATGPTAGAATRPPGATRERWLDLLELALRSGVAGAL